jgi:hypothetical protein
LPAHPRSPGHPTCTTLNGNTFTAGTYTLTGVAGKTLTFNKTLTLEGTDSTTMTFPATSATIARTDAAQTFTGSQTIAALVGPVTITEAVGSSGLTITGATQTSSFPVLNATQTWNASGTTFTAVKLNVTNTASASASLLLDLQVAGSSLFSVGKAGAITGGITGDGSISAFAIQGTKLRVTSGATLEGLSTGLTVCSSSTLGWSSLTNNATASPDAFFIRGGAAATIQLGADVNGAAVSQTLQACNGITGTDKTGGNLTLASGKGTGAGAVSSLIFQTPTVLASGTTAQSLATRLTLSSAGATFTGGLTALGGAVFLTTSSALTDGVGAGAGTITNAPAAGNPTKWIGINDNGTTRYIPAW